MGLINLIYQRKIPGDLLASSRAYKQIEYGGRTWWVRPGAVRFKVADVWLTIGGQPFEFGDYIFECIKPSREKTMPVKLEGKEHPHITGASICWGELRDLVVSLGGEHDVESLAGLTDQLARSYSRQTAYGGWWKSVREPWGYCVQCGVAIPERGLDCDRCDRIFCRVCSRTMICAVYEGEFCEGCILPTCMSNRPDEVCADCVTATADRRAVALEMRRRREFVVRMREYVQSSFLNDDALPF